MTTIEERAHQFALETTPYVSCLSQWQEMYKQIATEQQVIDKERFQNKIIQLFEETDGAEIDGSWWDMDELIDFLLG